MRHHILPPALLAIALTTITGCSAYDGLWADIPPYSPPDSARDAATDSGDGGIVEEDATRDTGGEVEDGLGRPINVTATGVEDGIEVTWSSVTDATGYELRIDEGTWFSVGDVTSHVDTDAPAPSLSGTLTVEASAGLHRPHVTLTGTSTVEPIEGPERSYEVRAVNQTDTSDPSTPATGIRDAPSVSFQWERRDGDTFVPLSDATTLTHEDTTASPLGTPHTYRLTATLGADGPAVTSDEVEGWRLAVKDIVSGIQSTCALLTNGNVKCWGANDAGRLATGDDRARGQTPSDFPTEDVDLPARAEALYPNGAGYCVLDIDKNLRCWGPNASGQLGSEDRETIGDDLGDFPIPAIDVGSNIIKAEGSSGIVGSGTLCALTDTNRLKCWGANGLGLLGQDKAVVSDLGGMAGDMPPPEVDLGGDILDFTMGFGYACAVLSTGKLKCWGGYSALAPLHPLGYFPIPTDSIGDDSGEMPPADSFITENPSLLSAGYFHTCAVNSINELLCWGNNDAGQLGLNDTVARPRSGVEANDYPVSTVDRAQLTEHYIRNPSAPQGTDESIIDLKAYGLATCILLEGGAVMCWGSGQTINVLGSGDILEPTYLPLLGVIHKLGQATGVAAHLCAIDTQGEALCWGTSGDGRLGYGGEAVDLRTERARIKLW